VQDAWFVPNQPDAIAPSGDQLLRISTDRVTLTLPRGDGFKPETKLDGVLVLHDAAGQDTALAVTATPGPAAPETGLWQAIGFALLGGLILNLMPCVFPVLAMKAMAIARLAHGERRAARFQAGAYTLGVLVSFITIGLALLALRALGHQAGWGFQFQSPVFVAAMAWVLFAVGLNLSGVFEVAPSLAGAGQGLTLRRGGWGSFFSGVLAVLVATPCTAPFMGVAIAAALTAPPLEMLAVFTAMGLGLAAPTALLAVTPGIARVLPRPGRWMDVLKQALAFPMYAAAAWLVWVISLQSGPPGVLAVTAGLVLIGFAAWALRLGARAGRTLALGAALCALALLPTLSGAETPRAETTAESYSPERLASLRAAGKPVFVNMTAAWCVTCLVNERVALAPASVQAAFTQFGVTQLKGDWTRQDPQISTFLRAQGRDGVPLYVFYPPENRPPIVLPQLLTEATVLDTLKNYAVGRP
jgi:thiol:disulfide interchange protein DsbD